jgi:hypothetical protein
MQNISTYIHIVMKKLHQLLALTLLLAGSGESLAQTRDLGARSLLLDDNTGGILTISYSGPGNSTFIIPPGGATTVQPGTLAGQTLRWSGTQWLTSGVLMNDGTNLTIPSGNLTLTAGTLSGNGSGLTTLNASNLTSGTVADARLSANVVLENITNTFTAANTFNNNVTVDPVGASSVSFGGLITQVFGQDVIGANFPLIINADVVGQTFGVNTWGRQLRFMQEAGAIDNFYDAGVNGTGDFFIMHRNSTTPAFEILASNNINIPNGNFTVATGTLNGNGSGLTNLNAANIASGLLPDARLSGNVAMLNQNETVNAQWTFNNNTTFTQGTTTRLGITGYDEQVNSPVIADNTLIVVSASVMVISSDDVTPANRTFTLPNGTVPGQLLVLVNNANNSQLQDAGNANLTADMDFGPGDTIQLIWSSAQNKWLELSRANN